MDTAEQKTVLIGVSGGVAAYKSCEIVRGLQKAGVRVKVMMTEHATHFIDPLTFRSLTHEPVAVGLFDDPSDPIHHISLAAEADVVLLAPCTANVMAKAAHGIADDLFSTTLLATTAPIVVAPAMNVHMYENAATQTNMETLKTRGFHFVEADDGYLACGDVGRGRLAEPERIVSAVLDLLNGKNEIKNDFAGKRVMVTAGPTVEPIDPVRYLTNRSSGKFGLPLQRLHLPMQISPCLLQQWQICAPQTQLTRNSKRARMTVNFPLFSSPKTPISWQRLATRRKTEL